MNIKEFLQICHEFFSQINPNIYDDEDEDEESEQILPKTYYELLEEDKYNNFFHNLCNMISDIFNPKIKTN